MFEELLDEIDMKALGLALILSIIFIFMVWGLPTWKDYSTIKKIFISIALPPLSYFIVLFQLNR